MSCLVHLVLGFALTVLFVSGRRHGSDIVQRPNDVTGASCGEEVRMTCIAKARESVKEASQTLPDIEWWYKNTGSGVEFSNKIIELEESRVSIHVEEFMVVRSTLVIKDLQPGDEGVYQCRASKSPLRHKKGANVYQHWKIEEAPIANLQCGKAISTIDYVIPTTMYNQSNREETIASTISSYVTSKKSPTKTSKKLKNSPTENEIRLPETGRSSGESHAEQSLKNIETVVCPTGTGSYFHRLHIAVYFSSIMYLLL